MRHMSTLVNVETFAELLTRWADENDLTKQAAMAQRLGVSQQQVSKWLGGHSLPDQDSLDDIAERMGYPADLVWSAYATAVAARGRIRRSGLSDAEIRQRFADLHREVADLRTELHQLAEQVAGTGGATSPPPDPPADPPRARRRSAAT